MVSAIYDMIRGPANIVMKPMSDMAVLRRLRGLLMLAEAAAEADAGGRDVWQYAVPIDVLRNHLGLTNGDLQWLISEGLVDHGVESRRRRGRMRAFRRGIPLNPTSGVCFVIRRAGLRLTRQLCAAVRSHGSAAALTPEWDSTTGALTFAGAQVKILPASATSQRKVLEKCQKENWSQTVESPFADLPAAKRGHYLSQVLDHLNHGQHETRVHFSSLEKGLRLRWRVIEDGSRG